MPIIMQNSGAQYSTEQFWQYVLVPGFQAKITTQMLLSIGEHCT